MSARRCVSLFGDKNGRDGAAFVTPLGPGADKIYRESQAVGAAVRDTIRSQGSPHFTLDAVCSVSQRWESASDVAGTDRLTDESFMHVERRDSSIAGGAVESRAPRLEPARHVLRETGHEFVLAYRGVTEGEISAVRRGKAAIALVVQPPLVMFVFRFGDAIPWTVAPCHWQSVLSVAPDHASRDDREQGEKARVCINLVDADGGRLCARRTVALSPVLTRAWNAAIRRLGNRSCSLARYSAAMAQFSRRFPEADALLSLAVASSVEGE
jgi:hypothetical protein